MTSLWAWLLDQLQRRCRHDAVNVTADILDGDGLHCHIMVRWCRLCGAYRRVMVAGAMAMARGDWIRPHPTWWLR